MCGIVGYTGARQAAPILLEGLTKLEYRGYDSAGIAVREITRQEVAMVKAPGRLVNLIQKTDKAINHLRIIRESIAATEESSLGSEDSNSYHDFLNKFLCFLSTRRNLPEGKQ